MHGLKTGASTRRISLGHAFVQNLRRAITKWGWGYRRSGGWPQFAELALVM